MASGSPQSGVGRVIAGRYLLLNRLGSGGMGHVWLAHDQRLACEVALKEIVFRSPGEAGDRSARVARARAEARHAAGLRGHPHVVTVHDVLEHEGLPWIVMEYVPGALDLHALVTQRGPLAPAECARIGLAVLDALTAGHERGVMHRDVKPANILLAPDRTGSPYARVLLTDYGISVQPDGGETRYTLTSVLVGTAGYLAPERAQGGPPTAAADLFSLGCTLYYAVEGYGPFDRDSGLAALTAVVLEEPRPTLRAGALEPLLAAMLTKDPVHRITAEEAEGALSAIVTPQPHPRTQLDPGSQPPWARGPPTRPLPGHRRCPGLRRARRTARSGTRRRPRRSPRSRLPAGRAPPCGRPRGNRTPSGRPDRVPGRGPPGTEVRPSTGRHRPAPPQAQPCPAGPAGDPARTGNGGRRCLVRHGVSAGRGRRETVRRGHRARRAAPGRGLRGRRLGRHPPFTGRPATPGRGVRSGDTEGQVMAVFETASADEARTSGAAQCEQRTGGDPLGSSRASAPSPSFRRLTASTPPGTVSRVCCWTHAARPLYGQLGDHREPGTVFKDTATMQKRDCLDVLSGDSAKLVSCDGPHEEQVLDFLPMSPDTRLEGRTRAGRPRPAGGRCRRNDYGTIRTSTSPPPGWATAPGSRAHISWSALQFAKTGAPWRETNHEEGVAMPGSTKTMGVLTVGGLVVVTAYTVALGSSGWLWFGWVVLGLITLAMVVSRPT